MPPALGGDALLRVILLHGEPAAVLPRAERVELHEHDPPFARARRAGAKEAPRAIRNQRLHRRAADLCHEHARLDRNARHRRPADLLRAVLRAPEAGGNGEVVDRDVGHIPGRRRWRINEGRRRGGVVQSGDRNRQRGRPAAPRGRGRPCSIDRGELNFKTGAGETGVGAEPLAQQRGELVLPIARVSWMGDVAGYLHKSKHPLRSIGKTDARRPRRP